MAAKSVLGRGLAALLKDSKNLDGDSKSYINTEHIPISMIEPDENQPRKFFDHESLQELSESIKNYGVIQPITVRKKGEKYKLISGERRLRASLMAGLTQIPIFIVSADENTALEVSLLENLQREDLNAIEIASTLSSLIEKLNINHNDLAKKLGKTRSTVSNYIRLLKLPEEIQIALRDRKLTMGHARALISIESDLDKIKIFYKIINDDLSVREVEKSAKNILNPKIKQEISGLLKEKINLFSKDFSALFKTKVKIVNTKKGGGEIKISFKSENELEKIIKLLQKKTND